MKERLIEFLRSENKSSAQFAEEIGVQPSGISHILSGRNNPSLDFVIKMLEKYRFLSSDWLLFGKGDMYKEREMQNLFNESVAADQKITSVHSENKPYPEEAVIDKENFVLKSLKKELSVEKIVWFFNDGSFREYFPGQK